MTKFISNNFSKKKTWGDGKGWRAYTPKWIGSRNGGGGGRGDSWSRRTNWRWIRWSHHWHTTAHQTYENSYEEGI